MEILLFSTPTCGQCKLVKQRFEKEGIPFTYVDCMTADGESMTADYGIKSVPVVLTLSHEGSVLQKVQGLPSIYDFINDLKKKRPQGKECHHGGK